MRYSLFSRYGVEIEYMVVDKDTLDIIPHSDYVLQAAGVSTDEVQRESGLNWSNELVAHVVEVRPELPVTTLAGLSQKFAAEVTAINELLAPHNACLLPTGAHPFMNPAEETVLWQHKWHEVYEHYDTVFNCRRHGWANLQSTHLNLSFQDDAEFAKLHAAIRLVLPLIPGIAASTPLLEGVYTDFLDSRLEVYRTNQARYPLITGSIVPEAVWSEQEYTDTILTPLYAQIAPVDPDKVLSTPALNSRGARVSFAEGRIEIRIIDSQECPEADIAITQFITEILQLFIAEAFIPLTEQQHFTHTELAEILRSGIATAESTQITHADYLHACGYSGTTATASQVLTGLLAIIEQRRGRLEWMPTIESILEKGTLSTRIKQALGATPTHAQIVTVYKKLAACLANNTLF